MPITNRNKVTHYFITFPRWKQVDLKEIPNKLPPMAWYIIVEEKHEDEDPDKERNSMIHYHISLILKQGIPFKKFIDWITKEWPHDYKRIKLETTKSWEDSIEYCKKESKNFLEFGENPVKKKMSNKWNKLLLEYEKHLQYKKENPSEFAITRDRLQREEVERLQEFVKSRYQEVL